MEAGAEKGLDLSSSKGSPVFARLAVPSNQVGCLLGKGGAIVSEMRKTTGAYIRIIGNDQAPKCASPNDEIVQVCCCITTLHQFSSFLLFIQITSCFENSCAKFANGFQNLSHLL